MGDQSRNPGRWIHLIENTSVEHPAHARVVLEALGIAATEVQLDRYFPRRTRDAVRAPTLELMELCNVLDPTNPVIKKKKEVGV